MPSTTPNLGLVKPLDNETADIQVINENMDVIDQAFGNINFPVTSVNEKSGDVVLTAADVGAETPEGAQEKVNALAGVGNTKTVKQLDDALGNHLTDNVNHVRYGVATATNAKVITLNPAPTEYVDGMAISFKNNTQNTSAVTLNINSLGAKSVVKSNGTVLASGNLKAGSIYTVRYNVTTGNFILQGEGGEYGTATAPDVLTGKTIGTEDGIIDGTMPNRTGHVTGQSISRSGTTLRIRPQVGYYDGSSSNSVQFADTNFVAGNIANGKSIFGLTGTFTGGGIKSVQYVEYLWNSTTTTVDVSISSVVPANTIVIVEQPREINLNYSKSNVELINATTVRLTRHMGGDLAVPIVIKVIEFVSAKSKQTGDTTVNNIASGADVTVSSVNVSKSILIASSLTTISDNNSNYAMLSSTIKNSNTLNFRGWSQVVKWQLIEFE